MNRVEATTSCPADEKRFDFLLEQFPKPQRQTIVQLLNTLPPNAAAAIRMTVDSPYFWAQIGQPLTPERCEQIRRSFRLLDPPNHDGHDPLGLYRQTKSALAATGNPEFAEWTASFVASKLNPKFGIIPPIAGGAITLAGAATQAKNVTERVGSFFELGPIGKTAAALTCVTTATVAWYVNTVTTAQGMLGSKTVDEPLAYLMGFCFNGIEIMMYNALTTRAGKFESAIYKAAHGEAEAPDVGTILTVAAILTAGIAVWAYDFSTTRSGLMLRDFPRSTATA